MGTLLARWSNSGESICFLPHFILTIDHVHSNTAVWGGKRVLQSSTTPPQEAAARSTVTSVPQVAFIARLLHDIKHWSLLLFLFPDSCLWIYNFHKDVQYKICTNNFADEWFADFWCIFVIVSLLYFNVCIVFDASVSCWVCELCLVTWAHSPSRQSPCSKKDGSGQVATVFIPLWRSENSTSMGRFTNQGKLAWRHSRRKWEVLLAIC